jgi:N-acetylglucosamine-6-phosphate deacetylase
VIVVHNETVKEIVSIDQWRASQMIQTDVGEIEDMGIDSVISCGMLDLQMNGGGGK